MPAPKGNRFWELRSSHGRNPKFKKPEDLWSASCEYFQWAQDNPLLEDRGFAFQGKVTHESFEKMRAMTLAGLQLYLDITEQTWLNYKERKGFLEVTTRINNVIRTQKFEGAAAELLNPNIIARDLGLKENVQTNTNVSIEPKEWIKDED